MFGGQPSAFDASARTLARWSRLSYGQTWITWFSGPTSVCQNAASLENFSRMASAPPKRSSNVGMLPGFSV